MDYQYDFTTNMVLELNVTKFVVVKSVAKGEILNPNLDGFEALKTNGTLTFVIHNLSNFTATFETSIKCNENVQEMLSMTKTIEAN